MEDSTLCVLADRSVKLIDYVEADPGPVTCIKYQMYVVPTLVEERSNHAVSFDKISIHFLIYMHCFSLIDSDLFQQIRTWGLVLTVFIVQNPFNQYILLARIFLAHI